MKRSTAHAEAVATRRAEMKAQARRDVTALFGRPAAVERALAEPTRETAVLTLLEAAVGRDVLEDWELVDLVSAMLDKPEVRQAVIAA